MKKAIVYFCKNSVLYVWLSSECASKFLVPEILLQAFPDLGVVVLKL